MFEDSRGGFPAASENEFHLWFADETAGGSCLRFGLLIERSDTERGEKWRPHRAAFFKICVGWLLGMSSRQ